MSDNLTASIKDGKVILEVDVSGVDLQEADTPDTVNRELASTGNGFMAIGQGVRVQLKVMGRCRKQPAGG
ncbi:hypothetical protein IQ16_01933 [Bradyrhizobium huanghuaihaiense]|uniref:Uncharacterized protein n=1 Tax=Bradyrhizobium huanghuaihaiense TaxID=990078 RepID=A0A562RXI3_9BRAD|nr:hypothetical protein [Bradyrhizobium huanghuaihaiense]TWI73789.1 hypothetical protein IQ16_01933 [Bradyrhizobium huanghuaihaiense]